VPTQFSLATSHSSVCSSGDSLASTFVCATAHFVVCVAEASLLPQGFRSNPLRLRRGDGSRNGLLFIAFAAYRTFAPESRAIDGISWQCHPDSYSHLDESRRDKHTQGGVDVGHNVARALVPLPACMLVIYISKCYRSNAVFTRRQIYRML
jgi:hypothetical protein